MVIYMKEPGSKSGTKMLTVLEFQTQFGDEQQCGEQLSRQRWPEGFSCARCGGPSRGYMASRQVHECARCSYQCSVTAGTIFHKTRVPLTGWFWAIYRLSHDKKGISAMQLKKEIGVSYQTAWLLLHKLRKVMADRDQGYKLGGSDRGRRGVRGRPRRGAGAEWARGREQIGGGRGGGAAWPWQAGQEADSRFRGGRGLLSFNMTTAPCRQVMEQHGGGRMVRFYGSTRNMPASIFI